MGELITMRTPGRPDALAVYARRMARMSFLRRHVEEGHPVLVTELQLIEMARSKLLEELISQHGMEGLLAVRSDVLEQVRSAMRRSASSLVSDAGGRAQLYADIESEPLDGLFPGRSS